MERAKGGRMSLGRLRRSLRLRAVGTLLVISGLLVTGVLAGTGPGSFSAASSRPSPQPSAARPDLSAGLMYNFSVVDFGPDYVNLNWTSPANAGSDGLTWGLSCGPPSIGSVDVQLPANSLNVTGLNPTTGYCFTLQPIAFFGPPYPPQNLTQTTFPVPPSGLTVSGPTPASLNLTWDFPTENVTSFTVWVGQSCPPSTPSFSTGKANATTVHSLASATGYCFAVSTVFNGTQSAPSAPAAGTTLPDAVSNLRVTTFTTSSIAVSWTNPSGTITENEVSGSASGSCALPLTPVSTAEAYNFAPLNSGTNYTLCVAAVSAGGAGPIMSASGTTLNPPPPMPTGLASIGIGQLWVNLGWTNPVGPILTDTVYVQAAAGAPCPSMPGSPGVNTTGATQTYNVTTGLTNGTGYCFWVNAWTNGGAGPVSTPLAVATLFYPPPAPTFLDLQRRGFTNMSLNWTNPPVLGLTQVLVQVQLVVAGACGTLFAQFTVGATSTYVVSGLTPATAYCFSVIASTDGGPGAASAGLTEATFGGPNGLTIGLLGDTIVNLSWTNPPGADVLTSTIFFGHTCGPTWGANQTTVGDVTGFSVTGLTPNSTYCFAVASNVVYIGQSPLSPEVRVNTTLAPPPAPGKFSIALVTDVSITLSWTNPYGAVNDTVLFGSPAPTSCDWVSVHSTGPAVTSYTVGGLSPGTTYCFGVFAWNPAGRSPVANLTASTVPNNGASGLHVPLWVFVTIAVVVVVALVLADLIIRRGWFRRPPSHPKGPAPPEGAIHEWAPEESEKHRGSVASAPNMPSGEPPAAKP